MSTELIKKDYTAVQLFIDGDLKQVLYAIKKEAEAFTPDMTTNEGRKEIASFSHKIAKSKTYIDNLGKDYVSDIKAKAKVIDEQRKEARETLDELKDFVRKPLTEYEEREKARVDAHEKAIREIQELAQFTPFNSSEEISIRLDRLTELESSEYEEFEAMARTEIEKSKITIKTYLDALEAKEAQERELSELRKKQAEQEEKERKEREERERKDREERIAKEAEERAKREAEEKHNAELQRMQREREQEEKRAEEQRRKEAEENKRREEDERHRAFIHGDIANVIGWESLEKILDGSVPHIKIIY